MMEEAFGTMAVCLGAELTGGMAGGGWNGDVHSSHREIRVELDFVS